VSPPPTRAAAPAVALTPDGYEALFRAHFPSIRRLAQLLGADDPEDVAQEAFVRLHRHRDRLRSSEAALPYLRRTAVNLSHSRLRHLRVVRREAPGQWVPHAESAESVGALREEHRQVVVALGQLPAKQRAVLVLRYWLDLSPEEIARTLEIPLGTVKSAGSRGMASLARTLGDPA
jgi:RNA polymerase sigma-70 factor (sigma-E family)